jgi:hypothetical protein
MPPVKIRSLLAGSEMTHLSTTIPPSQVVSVPAAGLTAGSILSSWHASSQQLAVRTPLAQVVCLALWQQGQHTAKGYVTVTQSSKLAVLSFMSSAVGLSAGHRVYLQK